jgi:hypothetical protein
VGLFLGCVDAGLTRCRRADGRNAGEHHRRAMGKFRDQEKFPAHGFNGPAERRDMHVSALLDLGNLLLRNT